MYVTYPHCRSNAFERVAVNGDMSSGAYRPDFLNVNALIARSDLVGLTHFCPAKG